METLEAPRCECGRTKKRVLDARIPKGYYWRCQRCRYEPKKLEQARRSLEKRAWHIRIVEAEARRRGGRCEHPGCEVEYAYGSGRTHWHHRDPSQKRTRVSKLIGKASNEALRRELEKCDLLCVQHHQEAREQHGEARKALRFLREMEALGKAELSDGEWRLL